MIKTLVHGMARIAGWAPVDESLDEQLALRERLRKSYEINAEARKRLVESDACVTRLQDELDDCIDAARGRKTSPDENNNRASAIVERKVEELNACIRRLQDEVDRCVEAAAGRGDPEDVYSRPSAIVARAVRAWNADKETLRQVLRLDQPWPLKDILSVLLAAADHLLSGHDCDHHGWERVNHAAQGTVELLSVLDPNTLRERPVFMEEIAAEKRERAQHPLVGAGKKLRLALNDPKTDLSPALCEAMENWDKIEHEHLRKVARDILDSPTHLRSRIG